MLTCTVRSSENRLLGYADVVIWLKAHATADASTWLIVCIPSRAAFYAADSEPSAVASSAQLAEPVSAQSCQQQPLQAVCSTHCSSQFFEHQSNGNSKLLTRRRSGTASAPAATPRAETCRPAHRLEGSHSQDAVPAALLPCIRWRSGAPAAAGLSCRTDTAHSSQSIATVCLCIKQHTWSQSVALQQAITHQPDCASLTHKKVRNSCDVTMCHYSGSLARNHAPASSVP